MPKTGEGRTHNVELSQYYHKWFYWQYFILNKRGKKKKKEIVIQLEENFQLDQYRKTLYKKYNRQDKGEIISFNNRKAIKIYCPPRYRNKLPISESWSQVSYGRILKNICPSTRCLSDIQATYSLLHISSWQGKDICNSRTSVDYWFSNTGTPTYPPYDGKRSPLYLTLYNLIATMPILVKYKLHAFLNVGNIISGVP